MDEDIRRWGQDEVAFDSFPKVAMASTVDRVPQPTFSKRKLSGQEKPRKVLRTGSHAAYERGGTTDVPKEDQVEQNFTDALDLIAAENATNCAVPSYYIEDTVPSNLSFSYLDKKPVEPVSLDTKPVLDEPNPDIPVTSNESKRRKPLHKNEEDEKEDVHQELSLQNTRVDNTEDSPTTDEPRLGPQALGLVPVQHPPQSSSSVIPDGECNQHKQLEEKISALEQRLTLLQNKHNILQESHDKLAQLVEAQNHLLACHTAPPPTREALSTFPTDESEFIQSPEPTTPVPESPTFVYTKPHPSTQQYKLPRKATAKDIIHLWEEGSKLLPPVKNWSPAQKMKVQSKLSRWKKIIDIFKAECDGDMETFEQKYSNESGGLLPVTTILALHENQLSSEFLSKGFRNTKLNTIELKSHAEIKKEIDNETFEVSNEDSTTTDEGAAVTEMTVDDEKTNRYVLPRKVTARDVVQLWDSGCDDFPAIGTWSKAQKIGQETKIFRWRKIVDIFKKDCDSDWDVFSERYSNEKGELLPLATILAKHDAMYAQEQLENSKQNIGSDTDKTTPKTPTTPEAVRNERAPRDPDSITLPRKVTAFEVVRYWTDGSETFGPVKDWTRAQKMGQETKISRWKKIYEIFRYQCYRDWDEFCRRYTNQRGELLPIATILAKYEAENPAGAPSYQLHGHESPGTSTPRSTSQVTGTDGDNNLSDGGWALMEPANVVISVNDDGVYVLPKKLSAVEALSLWEHGTEQVPPMKSWTEEQVNQKPLFASIQQIARIFARDCGSQFRRFVERFSDTDGELLPISGIIYSSESKKYSPYFTEYEKSIKQSRSRGEQYELPKRVSAKEIVWLWEHGCRDFPPVKAWSSAQKLRYTTKLSRWRKIVEIFHQKCDSNWRVYEEKYSNANGELLAISTVISMQDETVSDSYASMIKKSINSPESNGKRWSQSSAAKESRSASRSEKNGGDSDGDLSNSGTESFSNNSESKDEFHLPRKVNALDIINFWERGFGNMPPVAQWSPLQKFKQRSKISRWNKIYDIYKNHCRGDIVEFEKLYSDKDGQLLPATTIISMYESRVDTDEYNGGAVKEDTAPSGPVVRRYLLPRKVDAKDIVQLWNEGNADFPPIQSWSKADKIGQETKIFRWKKIVDIFMNYCDSDWDVFEDLFSNEYGELLPTSAIIAKYETSCTKD